MRTPPGTTVCVFVRLDGIAYITGEVVEDDPDSYLTLRRATWHRRTGRHHEFMDGTTPSVDREAYGDKLVRLAQHAVCAVIEWGGDLDLPSVVS